MTRAEENEKLARELRALLKRRGLFLDTVIYFNGNAFHSERGYIVGIYPEDYFEGVAEDSVSFSFEGPLYTAMGEHTGIKVNVIELGKKYGRSARFGDSWNMSFY